MKMEEHLTAQEKTFQEKDEPTWRCHQNPFISASGIQPRFKRKKMEGDEDESVEALKDGLEVRFY